jgi:hypothetical protein
MQHDMQQHAPGHRAMGAGMVVMAVMMGMCLASTVLSATASPLGVLPAVGLAAPAGVGFAAVSLRQHRLMGPLMAFAAVCRSYSLRLPIWA